MIKIIIYLSTLFLFTFSYMEKADNKAELIYINDPMCSWCYGFSPEITKIKQKYDTLLKFRMVMGGLRPGTKEVMDEKLKKFLKHHWEEVHNRSGQPFKYEIFQSHDFIYDTEPASRAVVTVRKIKPVAEFEFYKAVQTAFYAENKNTNKIETYLEILPRFDINKEEFEKLFLSDEMKKATIQDFILADSLGIRGFPALLLKKGDKIKILARGYTKSSKIEEILDKELGN